MAIILPMRSLVLVLMLALLPLRLWAAEGMEVRMAMAQLGGTASSMPADCPMLAEDSASPSGQTSHQDHGSAPHHDDDTSTAHCGVCQLGAAVLVSVASLPLAGLPAAPPEAAPAPFQSADPLRDLRPPIA